MCAMQKNVSELMKNNIERNMAAMAAIAAMSTLAAMAKWHWQ